MVNHKKNKAKKLETIKTRFLQEMEGKTIMDQIRNGTFRKRLKTKPTKGSIEESQPRRKESEARPTKKRCRGRPRRMWNDEIRNAVEKREGNTQDINPITEVRKR